jgi:hypothetical protein
MGNNGDTKRKFKVGSEKIRGLGSFHKSLPHNDYGEVAEDAFKKLVSAAEGNTKFASVPKGQTPASEKTAPLINPQAGLAKDRLTEPPETYEMPPAPTVLSVTAAAEMTELYWMSLLRDLSFDKFETDAGIKNAADEINEKFAHAVADDEDEGHLKTGVDVPGNAEMLAPITPQNVFRLGLPGEEVGPLVSQFFIRNINYGTQTIDQRERPYKKGMNYLTKFGAPAGTVTEGWLHAQNSGNGDDGLTYNKSNEASATYYEAEVRYISTMRDLARFVNKDALHQAYFNACLLLLSGGAKWTPGNPYGDGGPLADREAGFGTLGGPHILALVSEVATRALKIVWYQKWQTHLRLRPEAYGGLVHVQNIGVGGTKRPYGLPEWVATTKAAKAVRDLNKKGGEETLLLPMAFTAGSPTHPAYGAGHASVAGVCVTVLKAFFKTFNDDGNGNIVPIPLVCVNGGPDGCLTERPNPYLPPAPFKTYITGVDANGNGYRTEIPATGLTIEGELNKLAMNVAMGRSMGGVHWRTDNTRSLELGEAIAAHILADITVDLAEKPEFTFRTFSRKKDGNPKIVTIRQGKIRVDGKLVPSNSSAL